MVTSPHLQVILNKVQTIKVFRNYTVHAKRRQENEKKLHTGVCRVVTWMKNSPKSDSHDTVVSEGILGSMTCHSQKVLMTLRKGVNMKEKITCPYIYLKHSICPRFYTENKYSPGHSTFTEHNKEVQKGLPGLTF